VKKIPRMSGRIGDIDPNGCEQSLIPDACRGLLCVTGGEAAEDEANREANKQVMRFLHES
jgi:hypothetical protein